MSNILNIDVAGFPSRLQKIRGDDSLRAFGDRIGKSAATVQNYERGDTYPGIDVLDRISKVTGTSIFWLLTGQESLHTENQASRISEGEAASLYRQLRNARGIVARCREIQMKLEGIVLEEGEKLQMIEEVLSNGEKQTESILPTDPEYERLKRAGRALAATIEDVPEDRELEEKLRQLEERTQRGTQRRKRLS